MFMKKLIFLVAVCVSFFSCSDDNEIVELQGSWSWQIDMKDGICYTGIPFVAGEENISPVFSVNPDVRSVSYLFAGAFGGIPKAEKITCKLIFRKNDEQKRVIDEISVENATSINFNFEGSINDESYQDADEVYLYLQLIISGEPNALPRVIGYYYDYGRFVKSGEIEPF